MHHTKFRKYENGDAKGAFLSISKLALANKLRRGGTGGRRSLVRMAGNIDFRDSGR
jgi:hypothetical protein